MIAEHVASGAEGDSSSSSSSSDSHHKMGYFETLRTTFRMIRSKETPENPHSESFKKERWLAVGVVPVLFLFLLIGGGIDLGFNGLKPALIDSGVYFEDCLKHDAIKIHRTERNVSYCDEQLLGINRIFQITAAGLNTAAFFVGVFVDIFNRRATALTALIMWISGLLMFAFSDSHSLDLYVPGLISAGIAGAMVMFVGMRYKDQLPSFPGYGHCVEATFTIVWDLSSFVFLVFAFIYFHFGISLRVIIASYSIFCFLVFFTFCYFNIYDDPIVEPLVLEHSSSTPSTPSSSPPEHPSKCLIIMDLLEQMLDILKQITELRSIALTVAMGVGTTIGYFYMSSIFEQLLNVTSNDFTFSTHMLNVFSIMLPVEAFPETFIVSYFLHRFQSVQARYRLLCLGACIWVSLSLVHDAPYLQLLTFAVFILWRISAFATLYACVTSHIQSTTAVKLALAKVEAKNSSPMTDNAGETSRISPAAKHRFYKLDAWGSRAGLSLTFGGVLAFSIIPLNRIVMERMNGDFFIMNLSLLSAYCLACGFVEYAFRFYKTPEEKLLDSYNNKARASKKSNNRLFADDDDNANANQFERLD